MNGSAQAIFAVFGAVSGLVAGSFLATLAIRWPQGIPIARGRSRCDSCGAQIPAIQLVPVASHIVLRGRCARCAAPIDSRHVIMELVCGAIGLAALLLAPGWPGWAGALFGWSLAGLALLDHDHFWLPDRIVLPLAAIGLAGGAAGLSPAIGERLIGGVAGWAALAAIAFAYRRTRGREGLGQGDAKLLGAIGLWLGWRALPWVVLGACAIGIVWTGARAARGRTVRATDALPLGTLLAIAGWAAWAIMAIAGWSAGFTGAAT